jgi:hypothetical protein
MPSKSPEQAQFMRAVAHGWKPKGTKVPPIAVAKEFVKADQRAKSARKRSGGTISHGGK